MADDKGDGTRKIVFMDACFSATHDSVVTSDSFLASGVSTIHLTAHGTASFSGVGDLTVDASAIVMGNPPQEPPVPANAGEPDIPIDAERILAWITKPERLEVVLDIWDVNYRKRVLRDGETAARAWLWWQITRTLAESIIQLSPRLAAFIYLLRRIISFLFGP
jgi:hypothetical protein